MFDFEEKQDSYWDYQNTKPNYGYLNNGRELWDILRKNTWDRKSGTTFKEIYSDSKRDIEADMYGLMQGLLHPFSNANVLDKKWLNNLR